jgi:Golgi phosphoprotein 3 (GPP34)
MAVPPALADELFLISHDLQSGKARVPDPALGIALSSALLAELVYAGCLVIDEGQLEVGDYAPPGERLSEALYDETRNELFSQQLSVRDWLASHRRLVPELVADRLIRSGDLRREQVRRLGRSSTRYLPLKPSEAFIRTQRLPSYLRNRIEITEPDAVLAALVAALHTSGPGPLELDEDSRRYLDDLLARVSGPLRELLSITEAAILAGIRNPNF